MLKGRKEISLDILDEKLKEFSLMRFAAAMTALCIERIGLQEEFVPKSLLVEVKALNPTLIKKFEEDIFEFEYEKFSTNSLRDRIIRGMAFYKKRWKIMWFLDTSTTAFLLEKMKALIKQKKSLRRTFHH